MVPRSISPVCSICRMRPARRHHAVGFWKQCERCNDNRRRGAARYHARHGVTRKQCRAGCGMPAVAPSGWCSGHCRREYQVSRQAANKAAVVAALGGVCGCTESDCYHSGPCEVRLLEGLTVHHKHDDGHYIRNATRSGKSASSRPRGAATWSRYRRALGIPHHGMQLLCGTCHYVHTARMWRTWRASRP